MLDRLAETASERTERPFGWLANQAATGPHVLQGPVARPGLVSPASLTFPDHRAIRESA
jgi:hypothetical protein